MRIDKIDYAKPVVMKVTNRHGWVSFYSIVSSANNIDYLKKVANSLCLPFEVIEVNQVLDTVHIENQTNTETSINYKYHLLGSIES